MGILTEKKKNGAMTVDKSTKKNKTEVPKDPLAEPIVVSKKLRGMAKGVGIDIGAIVDRANLVQSRVLNIERAIMVMAKGLDEQSEELKPLVNLAKQIEANRQVSLGTGQPPSGQGGEGISLESLLPKILGGSEPDPMMKVLQEQIVRAGIENMFMGSALVKTMIAKVAPEMYTEAMKKARELVKNE